MTDDLRDKVARLIGYHEARCENPWNYQDAHQCADAILDIPEIRDALAIAGALRIVDRRH